MTALDQEKLQQALSALGDVLAFRGASAELAVVGGSGLLLLGVVRRATQDVDVVAVVKHGELLRAEPLPSVLGQAARDTALALDLPEDWLNPGPTELLRFGLPSGFLERAHVLRFGALILHVASRLDQIHFKLFAAVDQGPRRKHMADLRTLAPQRHELIQAARWCSTQDPSQGFDAAMTETLFHFGIEGGDAER